MISNNIYKKKFTKLYRQTLMFIDMLVKLDIIITCIIYGKCDSVLASAFPTSAARCAWHNYVCACEHVFSSFTSVHLIYVCVFIYMFTHSAICQN